DITSTKVAQDRLRFQAKLLDAVGQAVVASDSQGKVLYFNEAAEVLFGMPADHALGQLGHDLITSLATAEEASAISQSMSAGRTWSGYFRLQRHDGLELTLFVTNTPVLDDGGQLASVISAASDVT